MCGDAGTRVERVVGGVVAAALRDAGAATLVMLDDRSPEGELICGWLSSVLDAGRLRRASALASNMQDVAAADAAWLAGWRAARDGGALLAHPANRTALLLGGAPPRADLLPLGDLWASQVEALTGSWSATPEIEAIAAAAGSTAALDAALEAWVGRGAGAPPLLELESDIARRMVQLYDRGRYFRMRPRLVPKLGPRTLGIDLWD
ncbi:MAG: hypothetical protein WEF86_13375 [Gemmatimonadota bacterium]